MKNGRKFVLMLVSGVMALAVIVVPAIADELFGVLTKVDVEGKKVTVVAKETNEEVEVKVTDDTEVETPKGSTKADLAQLAKGLEKFQSKGRDGVPVRVTHEDGIASKISVAARKKGEPKPER